MRWWAAMAIILISSSLARAQPTVPAADFDGITAGQLQTACATNEQALFCRGYIKGAYETAAAIQQSDKSRWFTFCTPRTLSSNDVQQLFMEHMRNTPKDASSMAGSIVVLSVWSAYGCRKD